MQISCVSVAGADSGPASCCGLSLHCGGVQLLQEVLQQEWGWGWAGHEVRRHDDGKLELRFLFKEQIWARCLK